MGLRVQSSGAPAGCKAFERLSRSVEAARAIIEPASIVPPAVVAGERQPAQEKTT
jgi:hypothetical protein